MDGNSGLGRPFGFDAITRAQSAPGLSTQLAQALFRAARHRTPAAPREPVLPHPANDRQRPSSELASTRLCRFARRTAGR